ncbi:MAG: nicotinate (nicotinamide) nucleotide adenylyltransferase [Desulfovibrio sp.]|jgi:nicotinate-nucleotide adenylyltransferase|nr:nicotinate (nicotinamide) nucleotide adenylyltransferase [Desulfovibrio sp.]
MRKPWIDYPHSLPNIVLLGGSFNPPHIGHFRIAVEIFEILSPVATLFIPCANPPHKNAERLLPFDFRAALLRAVLAESDMDACFDVCEVENERSGPSYTADTLGILAARYEGRRLAFVMGGEDYAQLSTWRRWRELPTLADLVIVPRGEKGRGSFCDTTLDLWPDARKMQSPVTPEAEVFLLPDKGRAIFLSYPLLAVSSSMIRARWLQGRSLEFLTPQAVRRLLREQESMVKTWWNGF